MVDIGDGDSDTSNIVNIDDIFKFEGEVEGGVIGLVEKKGQVARDPFALIIVLADVFL